MTQNVIDGVDQSEEDGLWLPNNINELAKWTEKWQLESNDEK